ncbi:MAG: hypothetical protein ISS16_11070, partial [Ignavibacteria bacterium]|nr:hypothetical protein [Ignavibacteria bacterium]
NSCLNALQQKVGSVNSLFNGNIARMYTQIQELGNTGFNYKYDQLNRLITQKGWKLENNNMQSIGNAYSVKLKYDADGNILTLRRNGTFDKPKMDNLHYNYYTQNGAIYNPEILIPPDATNKLSFVNDYIPDGEYTEDIDKQGPGNYNYNLIGNLISDNKGNIEHIHWNLQNKVIKIDKLNGPGIGFEYDALGNRIMKLVGGSEENITFYVRDAQGNILTTYSYKVHENEGNTPLLYWDEAHLYGSSRIGLYKPEIKIPEGKIGIENDRRSPEEAGIIMFNKNLFGNIIYNINLSKKEYLSKRPTEPYYSETRGYKQYELTNHLGNVLATITDRKLPVINNGTVELYTADIKSGQDYYPGGMLQQDRSFSANSYRYGYQGSEKDDEITGVTGANFTTLFREGDTRTLRWWSTDPKANEQPWQSPYSYMDGNPIWFNDPQGDDLWKSEVDDEGNVNYIAEKRDTKKSFSEQYGLSLKETKEIFSRSGYFDKGKGIEESLVGEGNKIKISGESVKKSTGSEILKLDLSSTLATSQRKFDQLIFAMDYSKVSGKESFNPLDYFSKKSALVNPWTGVGGLTGKNVKIRIDNTNYEVSYFDADIYWNNPIQNRPNSISPDIPLRGETYHNIKFKHATGNQLKIYIQTPSYNTGRVNDRLNR